MKLCQRFTLIMAPIVLLAPIHLCAQQPKRSRPAQKPRSTLTIVQFDSGNSALRIPLEIDNNIILMRVRVNGSNPLKFIFDTGASFSMIDSKRAAELGLKTQGRFQGDATGGKIVVSAIEGVELGVQGAKVSNQTIAAMAIPMPPGFEFDGIIGYDFINQFVVEIDYLQRIMNLYEPRTYHYSGSGTSIPLLLAGRKIPLMNLKIFLEKQPLVEARVEVDTGADNTFVINTPFVKRHKLVEAMQEKTRDTRRGAGGESSVIVGHARTVQFGPFMLNNPPIMLSLDTEGAHASTDNDGVIGGEILRRFKVIIDYSRKQMILERNKSFDDPFNIEGGAE